MEDELVAEVEAAGGKAVSITDEEAQRFFDEKQLISTLEQVRSLLAAAKVNRILAQHGLLENTHDLHPRKFDAAIKSHRETIELLKEQVAELTETGLPETTATLAVFSTFTAPEGT